MSCFQSILILFPAEGIISQVDIDLMYLEEEFSIRDGLIIHAGANLCQENALYEKSGFGPIYWVEAIPELVAKSKEILGGSKKQFIVEATLWNTHGINKEFNISSNQGLSSSLFKMKWHRALQPSISLGEKIKVTTTTIDLVFEKLVPSEGVVSLLVLDLQGAELYALQGARNILSRVLSIHCEVSRVQLYESQPTFTDIDKFLYSEGFILVKHDLFGNNYSGDALYIRRDLTNGGSACKVPEDLSAVDLSARGWIKYRLLQLGLPVRFLSKRRN